MTSGPTRLRRRRTRARMAATAAAVLIGLSSVGAAPRAEARATGPNSPSEPAVRVATYNASLNRSAEGDLVRDLSTPDDQQAQKIAEVLQRTRPDVVLLNEFDYDADHRAADLFRANYLSTGQHGAEPIDYPYAFVAPSNTGVPSGHDLDRDGTVGGGNDAFGFGDFEGQYGMVILSQHPIDTADVRTFQTFLWKDMPGAKLPDDPATEAPADWYGPDVLADLRLSSKSHWDVPVRLGDRTVHILASHPTPPTFDGPEDRNGLRNHDEIRFWADYITPGRGGYISDDQGREGGLSPRTPFVILGDQNSDPEDGDSVPGSIGQLLGSPRLQDPLPTSAGAVEASTEQGGANADHTSNPRHDTADFADDPAPGNIRADYVLPSRSLQVRDAGVFWPVAADPLSRLTGVYPFPTSDHRLVWVDLRDRPRR